MKFNIWTFLFQLINFLVLLFILKRLLYRPVHDIMEKRRGIIDKNMQDAEKIREEAVGLKKEYEEKIAGLAEERAREHEKMQKEMADERSRLLAKAGEEARVLIEKEKVLFDWEKKRVEESLKEKIVDLACGYSLNLLQQISDEGLHKATYRKFLGELQKMGPEIRAMAEAGNPLRVDIATAYELSDDDLAAFGKAVEDLAGSEANVGVTVDGALMAGVKVRISDMVYDSSLSGQIE
jgi:F-type H+-transporting ATPase subunit b